MPHDLLKELHHKSPARHFLVAARQFAMLIAASAVAWNFPQPWIWIPAALVSGWTVFNFTVLLHDALHHAVFNGPHPKGDRILSLLYAIPSGISASQFTRWHLTHHAELGDADADPKRHYLSPRINKPWFKLLYFTPALFPIYFRAARKETASLPRGGPPQDRVGTPRDGSLPPLGAGRGLGHRRLRGRGARLPRAGLPRLPDRLRAEPARPALRDRSEGSGEVGLDPEAQPLLGVLVPLVGLPPRASLLPRACRSTSCAGCTSPCVRSSTRSAGRPPRTAGSSAAGSSRTRLRTPTGTSRAEPAGTRRWTTPPTSTSSFAS